jgi:hypothetical protein
LSKPIKVIPSVQSRLQKDFASRLAQITPVSAAVSAFHEGRIAIVTDAGLGMRWTWRRATDECAHAADGEVVWS